MGRTRRQISPKLKFQVVLEALKGEKTVGQIARAYQYSQSPLISMR